MDGGYVHGCPIAGLPVRVGMNDGRREVLAAVDVCYLRSGGARAAAVTAGDAAISAIQAWWTAPVPAALPTGRRIVPAGTVLPVQHGRRTREDDARRPEPGKGVACWYARASES
jgi:hypothetical protein